MSPVVLLALTLAASSAPAPEPPGALALAPSTPHTASLVFVPLPEVGELVEGALAPPPTTVVRKTRYYGTVTIDHRAHLARRSSCRGCHGPGPVTKIELTPKLAHARCIGCHREESRGPVACKDCHVKQFAPEPAPVIADDEPAARPIVHLAGADAPAGAAATGRPGAAPLAATSALPGAAIPTAAGAGGPPRLGRTVELGCAAGTGFGPSLRLVTREDGITIAYSLDRVAGGGEARTAGLFGAGVTRPVHRRLSLDALVVGGFDAIQRPLVRLEPALGARLGLVWYPGRFRIDTVQLSVTAATDLRQHAARGEDASRTFVLASLGTGFAFSRP